MMLSEFPDTGWKLGSINSLLKRIRKTGRPTVRQPASGRPRISGRPRVKKAPISSWDFTCSCHSPFKCAHDNSPWSPAQTLQTTSCSDLVWSQSHLPPHSL